MCPKQVDWANPLIWVKWVMFCPGHVDNQIKQTKPGQSGFYFKMHGICMYKLFQNVAKKTHCLLIRGMCYSWGCCIKGRGLLTNGASKTYQ